MKDSVLILSGGVDSVTLLYDELERIALAISFDYGSKHNAREIPFAQWHCHQLGIKHVVIPLDFMTKYFKSSLLEGGEDIPEGHYMYPHTLLHRMFGYRVHHTKRFLFVILRLYTLFCSPLR